MIEKPNTFRNRYVIAPLLLLAVAALLLIPLDIINDTLAINTTVTVSETEEVPTTKEVTTTQKEVTTTEEVTTKEPTTTIKYKETTTSKTTVQKVISKSYEAKTKANTEIVTEEPEPTTIKKSSYTYEKDPDDLKYLTITIWYEAGSDWISDRQQLGVGNVILNRAEDTKYFGATNSIKEVLTRKGQYAFVSNGIIPTPSESIQNSSAYKRCRKNAKKLLDGERIFPSNVLFQAEFIQGDGVYEKIGNTYFCYKY